MARKKQVAYPLQLLAVASLEALYQPKVALYQLGNIPFGAARTLKKQWAKGAVASAKVRRGGGGSGVGPHRPPRLLLR